MGMLSTVQCGELVERLKWLHQTTLENGLKQWLQRELAVLKDASSLPPKDEVLALLDRPKAR